MMRTPSTIIYHSKKDEEKFDLKRFKKNLSQYGEYDEEILNECLDDLSKYQTLHYSCLIETGTKALKNEEDAKRYYEDHQSEEQGFERLRRITGYLVGSLERWNDGKKAEEKARVKHNVPTNKNGVFSKEEKSIIEEEKLQNSISMQV